MTDIRQRYAESTGIPRECVHRSLIGTVDGECARIGQPRAAGGPAAWRRARLADTIGLTLHRHSSGVEHWTAWPYPGARVCEASTLAGVLALVLEAYAVDLAALGLGKEVEP